MKKGSLYQSTQTHTTKNNGAYVTSLQHSLRIEIFDNNQNYKREISDNNIIFYKNKFYLQSELSEQKRQKILSEILEETKSKNKKNKATKTQQNHRAKSIKSVRKYLEEDNEKNNKFYKLLSTYEEEQSSINKINLFKEFKRLNISSKVAEKNLRKYIDIINDIGSAGGNNNKVENIEFITKVPIDNDLPLDTKDLMKYQQDFFKRNFPQYEITVIFGHNDELHKKMKEENQPEDYERKLSGQHTHTFISGKNHITNEYDYFKSVNVFVSTYLKEVHNIEEMTIKEMIGEYGKQNDHQLKVQGELFQEGMYHDINKHFFIKYDYEAVIKFNERTLEEKQEIQRDSSQKISNRIFNGVKFEEERKKQIIKDIKVIEDKGEEISEKLSKEIEKSFNQFEVITSLKRKGLTDNQKSMLKKMKNKKEVIEYMDDILKNTHTNDNITLREELNRLTGKDQQLEELKKENIEIKEEVKLLKKKITIYEKTSEFFSDFKSKFNEIKNKLFPSIDRKVEEKPRRNLLKEFKNKLNQSIGQRETDGNLENVIKNIAPMENLLTELDRDITKEEIEIEEELSKTPRQTKRN